MMENCNLVFDANGYLPNGMRVFVKNIPLASVENAVADMLRITNQFLANGLTIDDPAFGKLEAGEIREKVSGVLRRQFVEDDGSTVPVVDIYPDNPVLGRRCVFYYLNDDKQIAEFEAATGLKLADMPLYSEPQLNRVEKPELAKKFIVPIKANVSVIYKDNPAYDPNAAKKKPKHLFIRWETANALPPPVPQSAASEPVKPVVADPPRTERLENEEIILTRANKTGFIQGVGKRGGDKFDAWGEVIDGGAPIPVRVTVFPEDVAAIREAGYEWREGEGLHVPVQITVKDRNMTRISAVVLKTSQNAGDGTSEQKFNMTLVWPKVRKFYDSPEHMQNSVAKLKAEGAFKACRNEADVINVIVDHKNGGVDFMADMPKASGQ